LHAGRFLFEKIFFFNVNNVSKLMRKEEKHFMISGYNVSLPKHSFIGKLKKHFWVKKKKKKKSVTDAYALKQGHKYRLS
jgi:hypothetical protein